VANKTNKAKRKVMRDAEHKELNARHQQHHPDFDNCRSCAQNPSYPGEEPRIKEGSLGNAVNIKHSCGRNQVGIRLSADEQEESNHPEAPVDRANNTNRRPGI